MTVERNPTLDRAQNWVFRAFLALARAIPYRLRIPVVGWLVSRIVAPLAGWRKRIRTNLAHVLPDLPAAEVDRLCRAVPENAGRTLAEMYSGEAFKRRAKKAKVEGPGWPAFETARAESRPVVLVSGHFGNYDVVRAALNTRGYDLGVLYRNMKNPEFNAHYTETMRAMSEPAFPATRKGLAGMIRYLSNGGVLAILNDVYSVDGVDASFFGQVAPTATGAVDWALRYDALVIPFYVVRQRDGLSFNVEFHEPIPHGDPFDMVQALNDSLESEVRGHMEQWFWIHRRWKPGVPRLASNNRSKSSDTHPPEG